MALYYFDTSALAKRYIDEIGSQWVDAICLREEVATSTLVQVEIASALARRVREGILTAVQAEVLFRQYRSDEIGYAVIDLSTAVLANAAELLMAGNPDSRLRALDALHLASAQISLARLRPDDPVEGIFVTSDRHLARAASALGFVVVNPEET